MKHSSSTPSATSLPRAPRDEVSARSVKYLTMMGVRIACFGLMVLITPYGWYTWVFGAGAIFLPYIAVVIANVGQEGKAVRAENPERALAATPEPAATDSRVVRITEKQELPASPVASEPADGQSESGQAESPAPDQGAVRDEDAE